MDFSNWEKVGEGKGVGVGNLNLLNAAYVLGIWSGPLYKLSFFIFTARKTGKFYPYFICGETAHGHVVKWQEEIGTEVCSFHSTTVPASEDSIQH